MPNDLEQAQSLELLHHEEQALAAWSAIRQGCKTPDARPHDDCGLAATREAQLLEQLGRYPEAAAAWEALPARTGDPRKAARALVRAAEIAVEKLNDPDRAAKIAWRCVDRYPDEVPADDALAIALRIDKARDPKSALAMVDQLLARHPGADVADNLWFASAEIARGLGAPKDAVARWDELAKRIPGSGLRDDAWWKAAGLLREIGDFDGARHRLQQILDTRNDAVIVGSYNSILLDDAQLAIGQLFLDDLHDVPKAIEAFKALADDYPASTLRDDGLFELARAELAANDRPAACAALARLVKQFPDGNRVRAGREKSSELHCQ